MAKEEEKKPTIDELLVKLEKIDGKLEVVDRFRETTDERTSRLSEQIGELRSMIMERERTSRNMEADFEKIKTLVKEIDPMALVKESEKKEKKIIETQVKIEKLENTISKLGEEVSGFRKVMDKIKSFENLVDLAKEVRGKISDVEDSKKYTDRLAAKVEAIFGELNKKLLELEEYKTKIDNLDELTRELVKSLDEAKMNITDMKDRVEKLPTSKDFEDKYLNLVGAVDALEKKTRILELEKISEDLGERMKELGTDFVELKRLEELSKERRRITELMTSVEEDHKQGLISDDSYEEVKKKNQELLVEIKAALRENFLKLEHVLEIEIEKPPPVVQVPEKLILENSGLTVPEMSLTDKMPDEARIVAKKSESEVIATEMRLVKEEEAVDSTVETKKPSSLVSDMARGYLDKKLRLLETEREVVQNLLGELATSGIGERKRAQMEKKYRERIEKLTKDISAIRGGG